MSILPQVRPKDLLKALKKEGFEISRKTGSHAHLKHPDGRLTSVSVHPGVIPTGTLGAILKQTKLTIEKLKRLL
jgi:predicted RNA binding protein YcfA (HicA-like mRNA interferase family)